MKDWQRSLQAPRFKVQERGVGEVGGKFHSIAFFRRFKKPPCGKIKLKGSRNERALDEENYFCVYIRKYQEEFNFR